MNGTLVKTCDSSHFTASEHRSHLTQIGYSFNQRWTFVCLHGAETRQRLICLCARDCLARRDGLVSLAATGLTGFHLCYCCWFGSCLSIKLGCMTLTSTRSWCLLGKVVFVWTTGCACVLFLGRKTTNYRCCKHTCIYKCAAMFLFRY